VVTGVQVALRERGQGLVIETLITPSQPSLDAAWIKLVPRKGGIGKVKAGI
jgi:hypothetical protein